MGFSRNGSIAMTNIKSLNDKYQNGSVAKCWLSTLCFWEAAVHTLD